MHIALLNDDALPAARGGAAVVVDTLREGYERAGHRVTLVTAHRDSALGSIVRSDGMISLLSDYPPQQRHRRCLGTPAMRAMLSDVFAELRPDAVHCNNIHEHLTYESLLLARAHTDRVVLTAHDVFLVAFARVRGPRFERASLAGKPYRMHWWEHPLSVGRKYWPLRNAGIRRILAHSQAKVVAVSNAHRTFLEANGITVATAVHNGTTVSSPVSADRVREFRKRLGLKGPTILFGGRLSEDKGSTAVLEAFAQVRRSCPQAELLIAGEAERIADTLNRADRTGIVCAGWLSQEEMRVAYTAATVVTTPSLCFEPCSMMNIEAMAEGAPVVASGFGGTPEIVEEGVTGLIVYPRDTAAYAAALLSLLQSPERAKHMGARGRERIASEFSAEKQCTKYLALMDAGYTEQT